MAEREMPSYNEQSNGRKSEMAMNKEFRSGMIPPEGTNEAAWWFAFRADRLLVHEDLPSLRIPRVVNFSDLGVAARAVQIVDWERTHRFCGRCGVRTESQETERAKVPF
jgi:NADH pyrophosphatase NudC (nudix superfamily)